MYEVAVVNNAPFSLFLTRRTNEWFTACDGNWSNPNTWLSNALDRKLILVPQPGDTVYINHTITMDSSIVVNNMYISGKLQGTSLNAYSITINGDIQVSGSGYLDLSLQFNNLILNGYNNLIPAANFNAGSYSTVTYNGIFDQFLLNIPYHSLTTQNGKKYQVSDITLAGNFNQQSNYEVGAYNLTINGTSTIGTVGQFLFSKNSSTGSILFVGAVDFEGNTDLSVGNPNVEFRGGFQIHTFQFISGSGTFTFSTNNQTANFSAYLGGSWAANIVISGAITLTWTGNSTVPVTGTINGTVSTSTLNNTGILYLGNSATPMTTGVFSYAYTTTSTLGYTFNGAFTLPYSSYAGLYITGTGTKKLGANTTLSYNMSNSGTFDCNGYNLSVAGTFTNNNGDFFATSFSSILFTGFAEIQSGPTTGFDLRTGNPNVEFRAGIDIHANQCWTGTGIWKFSTNNQSIGYSAYNGGTPAAEFLISGAITVTFTGGTTGTVYNTGVLNGDNASSIFINNGTFLYTNAQEPMQTGKLYCNQAANTFVYGAPGAQNIIVPSDPTSPGYKNLTLNGSGAKTLLGNVSVKGTYTLTSPATLNLNGYSLTNP